MLMRNKRVRYELITRITYTHVKRLQANSNQHKRYIRARLQNLNTSERKLKKQNKKRKKKIRTHKMQKHSFKTLIRAQFYRDPSIAGVRGNNFYS